MIEPLDVLRQRLSVTTDTTERIDLLIQIARRTHQSDPDGARRLGRNALKLAKARGDMSRIARALTGLGFCDYVQRRFDSGITLFRQALPYAQQSNDADTIARALQGMAVCQTEQSLFVEAMANLVDALSTARAGKCHRTEAMVLNSTGFIHMTLCDYPKALDCFQSSLAILEELGEEHGTMLPLNNIGKIYLSIQDNNQAELYFRRMYTIGQKLNDQFSIGLVQLNLGEVHERRHELNAALDYFRNALEIMIALGDKRRQAYLLNAIGMCLTMSDNREEAIVYMEQALELAIESSSSLHITIRLVLGNALAHSAPERSFDLFKESLAGAIEVGDRDIELRCHQALSRYYEGRGDGLAALEHYKRATELREEIMGRKTEREITQMQMRTEIERAAREKEQLRLEKEQLEVEIEHTNRELAAKALQLVEKHEFLGSLKKEMSDVAQSLDGKARPAVKGLMRQLDGNIDRDENWKLFEEQFEKVNNNFLQRLSQRYPGLSRTELKICALLKLNLSSKEIAAMLVSSERTIRNHRYRIRKKLDLDEEANLTTFFASM